MVLRFNVGGKVVERVDLIRKKKWPWRLDILPFAILYAVWMVTIVPSIDIVDALIVLGGLVSIHVLALLFTAWSVDFECFVQYSKVNDIYAADSCKVTPAKFSGSKEVVPLHIRQQLTVLNRGICNVRGSSKSKISNFHFMAKETSVDYFHPGTQT